MSRRPALTLAVVLAGALALPVAATAAPPVAPGSPPVAPIVDAGARPDRSFGPADRAAALRQARADAPAVARALGLSDSERLVARSVEQDADGTRHVRYDRTVGGLEVIGGDLVVHQSVGGAVRSADLATEQSLAAVWTGDPVVGRKAATRVAASRQHLADGSVGAARLVVWAVDGVPRPAWQVEVDGVDRRGGPVRRVEYVDAGTGRYIAGWSSIQHADGSGQSLYSGTVPLKTTLANGRFQLKDTTRGGARTVDVFNGTDPPGGYLAGTIFTDPDNAWGNGSTSSRQSAAVDVAFGGAETWDYFKQTFGRSGIRGDGVGAKSRVHYGNNYDNAFWDDDCFCMTYGDGGTLFNPLVSLDVAGHEMTHGVTSNTAGLRYFGESGGLNEATSDIFGTMVEFGAGRASDPGDYYIGEEITKPAFGPFLRRMDTPSADGSSYDCWTIGMGYDDVHYSSGPANKFFYLLSEGTGSKTIGGLPHNGTSCNGTTFAGIGKAAAAKIWWRALSVYMTSTTSYIDARDATIRATKDLFPAAPKKCTAVVRAWKAVDVPAGYWTCQGQLDEGASVLGSNPGFESGNVGWARTGSAIITNNQAIGWAHSGSWWANFAMQGTTSNGLMTRSVTVPNTATAHLRFDMLVYTEDSIFSEFDTFDVLVNGTKIGPSGHWSNLDANNTYIRWDVPMSRWAGQTVTLGFRAKEDFSGLSQFLVDDVTLTPR